MDSDAPPAMASPNRSDGEESSDDVIEIPRHLLDMPSKTAFSRRDRQIQERRSRPSGMLRLAIEVRLMIYNLLFEDILDQDTLDRTSCFPRPPVLRTCRVLNIEACKLWQVHLDFAIRDATRRHNSIVKSLEQKLSETSDADERSQLSSRLRTVRSGDRTRESDLSVLSKVRSRLQPTADPSTGYVHKRRATVAWWKKLPKFKGTS